MANLRLFHFDIPTWGNYGDKALFPVVRDAFRVLGDGVDFTSAAALRREVDRGLIDRINARSDAVVIGGGGLFLQDTNPNRLSGWQWKISAEALAAIEVPLIVYALGDNRFPGQPEFDDLMRSHVSQVLDQSVFFGLRNTGSIETMSKLLGVGGASGKGGSDGVGGESGVDGASGGSIRFQPCPTTIAGLLYEPLIGRRPDPSRKVLAIQMLVHPRQSAAGYDAEVIHRATVEAARMLVAKGWTILSVPFHPDDAEVSAQLVEQVPEVEEVRLYGSDVGFFNGFDLFASVPYVLGGRGHAQMIPFGVGSIPISLDLHAKLGYFARDIGHPELIVPVGREGVPAVDSEPVAGGAPDEERGGTDPGGGRTVTAGGDAAQRSRVLAERIVDRVEDAYAQGSDLQDDLLRTRQGFFTATHENHLAITDALRSRARSVPAAAIGSSAPGRSAGGRVPVRTVSEIRTEEFHLAAVSEAEEFSAAQTRELSAARREHRRQLDEERSQVRSLESVRDALREELREARRRLEQCTAEVEAGTVEAERLSVETVEQRRELAEVRAQLRSVTDRTTLAEAKVLVDKTCHGLKWRARRLIRRIRR